MLWDNMHLSPLGGAKNIPQRHSGHIPGTCDATLTGEGVSADEVKNQKRDSPRLPWCALTAVTVPSQEKEKTR